MICLPHPDPLPDGEGTEQGIGFAIPSPSGRGTQGEGVRATISVASLVLRQFQMPVSLAASSRQAGYTEASREFGHFLGHQFFGFFQSVVHRGNDKIFKKFRVLG